MVQMLSQWKGIGQNFPQCTLKSSHHRWSLERQIFPRVLCKSTSESIMGFVLAEVNNKDDVGTMLWVGVTRHRGRKKSVNWVHYEVCCDLEFRVRAGVWQGHRLCTLIQHGSIGWSFNYVLLTSYMWRHLICFLVPMAVRGLWLMCLYILFRIFVLYKQPPYSV